MSVLRIAITDGSVMALDDRNGRGRDGFDVLGIRADIADMREREADDLRGVRGSVGSPDNRSSRC
jgi:hypothetical protein